jgi:hypothetical protein
VKKLSGTLGLFVVPHKKSGRWTVPSRELARATAHEHGNILGAVRLAEQEIGPGGEVFWSEYISRNSNSRVYPCCYITREVMAQIRLHNVPGCSTVREVIDEYLRMLDEKEAEQAAARKSWDDRFREIAEPAPDSEIRPPDPEPHNVFELVPKQRGDAVPEDDPRQSWLINAATEALIKVTMPDVLRSEIVSWNADRCNALFKVLVQRGTPATEAAQVFSTLPYGTMGREKSR